MVLNLPQSRNTESKAARMVSRNYDIGGGESTEAGSSSGATDIVLGVSGGSQRRSISETSGTVSHGRFQYLGDRPFDVTNSLKGYNQVSEFLVSLYVFVRHKLGRRQFREF
jgi:hypothetical protein